MVHTVTLFLFHSSDAGSILFLVRFRDEMAVCSDSQTIAWALFECDETVVACSLRTLASFPPPPKEHQ
jgi:hypothetical protein